MVLSGEDSPSQGSWKKLDFIPEKYMGQVIGKYRRSLDKIENITGATLKVFERNVYIKGSIESQKRAIREIKDIVNLETKRPNHSVRFVHVDTTQLELDHEFELWHRTTYKCL
ncbi:hypothetical protein OS493_001332 [Desmophyllum pertusum]|uniref:K Homology domain-containing protein n=1 Tax=Desmophyllum pertusum TaxID=174260 RepID=A0A9X0D5U7_9CNID|nr:hypothetical protein OS493_001332 [Desmophyllum pertusum]